MSEAQGMVDHNFGLKRVYKGFKSIYFGTNYRCKYNTGIGQELPLISPIRQDILLTQKKYTMTACMLTIDDWIW